MMVSNRSFTARIVVADAASGVISEVEAEEVSFEAEVGAIVDEATEIDEVEVRAEVVAVKEGSVPAIVVDVLRMRPGRESLMAGEPVLELELQSRSPLATEY